MRPGPRECPPRGGRVRVPEAPRCLIVGPEGEVLGCYREDHPEVLQLRICQAQGYGLQFTLVAVAP